MTSNMYHAFVDMVSCVCPARNLLSFLDKWRVWVKKRPSRSVRRVRRPSLQTPATERGRPPGCFVAYVPCWGTSFPRLGETSVRGLVEKFLHSLHKLDVASLISSCNHRCVAGCCLIPFFTDYVKDVHHQCPRCQTHIHTYQPFEIDDSTFA